MNLNELLPEKVAEVEQIIYKYIPKEQGYQRVVMEAMEYSVKAGGKRLRPIIMQETYKMFGGVGVLVEPFMAALEMIHTYSLVHDDLPAMDNDTLRRGMDTTWVKYGDAMAVLTGDALLNFAFETAISAFELPEVVNAPELMQRVARALSVLATKAGIYGMVGGQVADVEAEKKNIKLDENRLNFIHELKTGALLQAAFMIGAILAGAGEDQVESLQRAALDIGVAFQIKDDILDVVGDQQLLGKNIGSDAQSGKETYVDIYGMDKAQEDVKALSREAIDLINELPYSNEFLMELIKSLIDRDY